LTRLNRKRIFSANNGKAFWHCRGPPSVRQSRQALRNCQNDLAGMGVPEGRPRVYVP